MEHFEQNKTGRNSICLTCVCQASCLIVCHTLCFSFFLVSRFSALLFPPLFPVLLHVFISLLLLSKSPLSFSLLPLFSHTSPLISSFFFFKYPYFFALFNFPPFSCLVCLPLFRSVFFFQNVFLSCPPLFVLLSVLKEQYLAVDNEDILGGLYWRRDQCCSALGDGKGHIMQRIDR